MAWHAYDYLFALSMIFAFLDAYGIGANDVANSWATSVSSRSVTFKQAMLGAAICEFLGAVLVGARVTSTIKNGVIDLKSFNGDAGVTLLAFTCVIIGASAWMTVATRMAMPVSTTHTVVGSLIGVGIAVRGNGSGVKWGWNGVAQIFASWGIAPVVSGGFAAIIFLVTKFLVLRSKNPVQRGLILSPVYFFIVAAVLTTAIIVKGSPSLNLSELPTGTTIGAIFGTASVVSLLSILFWLPWVHCQVVRGDYTIRWYHIFLGPLLWRRQPPADAFTSEQTRAVRDYYEGHHDEDHVRTSMQALDDVERSENNSINEKQKYVADNFVEGQQPQPEPGKEATQQSAVPASPQRPFKSKLAALEAKLSRPANDTLPNGRPRPPDYKSFEGSWLEPWNLYTVLRYNALPWVWYTLTAGIRTDVHKMQMHGSSKEVTRLRGIHSHAAHYDNNAEHLYSFLQVMTACTASFAHGANDVSNAIGPLSVVYSIWSSAAFPGSKEPVPVWILAYGGAAIVIGLSTYGWKLMSVLGNRLTLHSPSRGFSMELGASCTVVIASYLGLPVSTTQSITGATIAVALCNGDWRSVNWKGFAWIFFVSHSIAD
ncbi:putative PHO89-Na+/phosphate co-transporter [Tilletiaria anomala UBC 951]|uniref:Phosphate transporter n=1 Tax=Tilletiaria anomala (strain ATCC 24038 / CBS 436.72 / UBC 951) TaxID=1037660 RepID=A0A066V572_TILAU|nr:putative PHO89-Na+/phosphate co-transporter [Tilletiaria anomala UBC 951]KDN36641.1 putative PHO89-Na+/phosphate co-transporter [Tilletiaria anomala UBC 951]